MSARCRFDFDQVRSMRRAHGQPGSTQRIASGGRHAWRPQSAPASGLWGVQAAHRRARGNGMRANSAPVPGCPPAGPAALRHRASRGTNGDGHARRRRGSAVHGRRTGPCRRGGVQHRSSQGARQIDLGEPQQPQQGQPQGWPRRRDTADPVQGKQRKPGSGAASATPSAYATGITTRCRPPSCCQSSGSAGPRPPARSGRPCRIRRHLRRA